MPTTRELLQKRNEVRAQMARLHGDHPGELPPDAQAAWSGFESELRNTQAALDRQASIDAADRAAPGVPLDAGHDLELHVPLTAAIRAQLGHTDREAGRAREISQEIARRTGQKTQRNGIFWQPTERRTLTSGLQGTSGNAAALVEHVQRGDQFISTVYASTVTRLLGAQTLDGLVGINTLPRQTAPAIVYWPTEGAQIPLTDIPFDNITLTPHTLAARVEFTHNMVITSNPDIQQIVENGLARSIGVELDRVALVGTGAGGQPIGIAAVAPVITYDKAGLTFAYATSALTALEAANFQPNGWAVGPGVRGQMMQTAQTNGQNLLMSFGGPLMGMPQASTTNLAANQLIVGDFTNLLIATWGPLEILANPFAAGSYEAGNVQVRALLSCDVAVRNPAAFRVLNRGS